MKYIKSVSLFAALPAAAGSVLRGSTRDIEATVFGDYHRNLDQCVGPSDTGGDDGMATCCMPDAIDLDFFKHEDTEIKGKTTHRGSGDGLSTSYWHIEFDDTYGGNLSGVTMSGWCVDLSRGMSSGYYWFEVYSTYDDFPYDNVLDSPDKLANVNWMINNFDLGTTYTVPANANEHCPNSNTTATLHWQTMQNAIWRTVDRGVRYEGSNAGVYENSGDIDCLTYYMRDQADLHGDHYEPSCDDLDAHMAVILIVDSDENAENTISKQVIIGEAKLSEISGSCKPAECCEQLSVNHETFQDNTEILITFSQGGTDSAWEVSFDSDTSGVYPDSLNNVDAWSVDLDRDTAAAVGTFMVDTYSSYDNWYRFNVVDKKENIPKVNYLINTYEVGTTTVSSCNNAVVSIDDFQDAVWELMDNSQPDASRGNPNVCVSNFLVSDANTNGVDYEPSCAEGTADKLAVLLIVDTPGAYKWKFLPSYNDVNDEVQLESVTNQVMIAAVPLSAISGACYMKDCNCCPMLDFPVGSPTDTRNDPTPGAPVGEISTPAPAPTRPVCLDPFEIMGSTFGTRCGHKGVEVVASNPGAGGPSPALRIDILDTFFGIVTGSDETSVSFRAQNPFSGGAAVDMYIQYEGPAAGGDRVRSIECASDPHVDECQAFGATNGLELTAECVDPRIHDASKQPYALVTAYFVESGGRSNLFTFSTTNDVPECCEPDPTNTGTVVSYTFEIMCTCPQGTDAQF